jgi:hypothetical protein
MIHSERSGVRTLGVRHQQIPPRAETAAFFQENESY